ncbi:MAG: 5'-methylthioadenosine/S-adenosylhomocysteine nucleosidase [Selenomonadaceae bacterium]|nr:5'-methylthioadenosine/S-adenosylhomocysteine nucleosidase [Selenomonadaceae bacterium]
MTCNVANAATGELTNAQVIEKVEQDIAKIPVAKSAYKSLKRPIMIQGAMNSEIGTLIKSLRNPVIYKHMNYVYIAGTYKNYPVVIARTEKGMENAAAVTALGIEHFNPIAVINQGTAGGYSPTLHRGDIVIGEKTFNYAAYRIDENLNRDFYGTYAYDTAKETFQQQTDFFSDTKLLSIAKEVADSHKEFNTAVGVIASADTWTSNSGLMKLMNENYGVLCEEMETASAAQICQTAGVPFIGIRVLSNNYTNGEDFSVSTAYNAQRFILYVVASLIQAVKGGEF